MHSFTFNGENSAKYGLLVSGRGTFNAPERDIESVVIPGRNGELTLDNGRFKNITVTYPAFVIPSLTYNSKRIRSWLCSVVGYATLVDDYDPSHFRKARFVSGLEFEPKAMNKAGECYIQFDCMPQRWLSDDMTRYTEPGTVTNPTLFTAQPKIVTEGAGDGTITINGNTLTFEDVPDGLVVDSEIQRSYKGTSAYDGSVSGTYPTLVPGTNTISFTGFTMIELYPRWWEV